MSYFERLNAIKGQLQSKLDSLQDTQDNIATSGEEILSAKIKDVAEKLEAVGGGGMLIMKGAGEVKKLYNKYKGKKDKTDEPTEPTEEGEVGQEEEPFDIQMGEIPELEDEPATEAEPVTDEAIQGAEPSSAADVESELFGNLKRTEFVTTREINANPEMFKSATKLSRGEEVANYTDDQFEELRARVNLGLDTQERGIGMRPVESDVVSQARASQNTGELSTEGGEMDSLYPMRAGMERNVEPSGRARATQGEGLGETQTQQQIMDLDPESATAGLNSGSTAGQTASDVLTDTTNAVNDAVNDAITGVTDAGSSLLDTGLAIGEVALDAIPVIGEIGLIGTAIAGFFESIFGGKPKVPDTEIIGDSGLDASAIVKQAATAIQV